MISNTEFNETKIFTITNVDKHVFDTSFTESFDSKDEIEFECTKDKLTMKLPDMRSIIFKHKPNLQNGINIHHNDPNFHICLVKILYGDFRLFLQQLTEGDKFVIFMFNNNWLQLLCETPVNENDRFVMTKYVYMAFKGKHN